MSAVTAAALVDFRTALTTPDPKGKGLAMKTARDVIDGTLRAMYRDAREIDLFVVGDPFTVVKWPRKVVPTPDPFAAAERDLLLDYFWQKKRHYYPLVFACFYTGIRTGEAVGLRWGAVDLRRGVLTVRLSRTLGEDNTPKTQHSNRDIPLRPELVTILRDAKPLRADEAAFVFTSQAGNSLDAERFVEKHWRPALRATNVRPRKFYATRHTFISLTLMAGVVKLKRLAMVCGTSIEMIEKHYAKWMDDDRPEELAAFGGSAPRRRERATVGA